VCVYIYIVQHIVFHVTALGRNFWPLQNERTGCWAHRAQWNWLNETWPPNGPRSSELQSSPTDVRTSDLADNT